MTLPGGYLDQLADAGANRLQLNDFCGKRTENKGFHDHAVREALVGFGTRLRMNRVNVLSDLGNRRFLRDVGRTLRWKLKSEFICVYQLGGGV